MNWKARRRSRQDLRDRWQSREPEPVDVAPRKRGRPPVLRAFAKSRESAKKEQEQARQLFAKDAVSVRQLLYAQTLLALVSLPEDVDFIPIYEKEAAPMYWHKRRIP